MLATIKTKLRINNSKSILLFLHFKKICITMMHRYGRTNALT